MARGGGGWRGGGELEGGGKTFATYCRGGRGEGATFLAYFFGGAIFFNALFCNFFFAKVTYVL